MRIYFIVAKNDQLFHCYFKQRGKLKWIYLQSTVNKTAVCLPLRILISLMPSPFYVLRRTTKFEMILVRNFIPNKN